MLQTSNNNQKLYQQFIPQNRKNINENFFIGSQPLQIQKKSFPRLLNISTRITPKIDGVRYLLIAHKKTILLINRSSEFFTINENIKTLTNDKTFLIDTEVYYNKKTKTTQIFVFDFLSYQQGKTDPHKIYKLPYHQRMKLLFKHFLQGNTFDQYNTILTSTKFYYKGSLEYSNVYTCKTLQDYYDTWIKYMNFKNPDECPPFDGLIFINIWSRYFLHPQPSYGQYKWKPPEELTVDLKVNKKKQKVLPEWTLPNGTQVNKIMKWDTIPKEYSTSDTVLEFKFQGKGNNIKLTIAKNIEREKKENSIATLQNVLEAYQNPVNVEQLHSIWTNVANNTPQWSKEALQNWMTKESAMKLLSFSNNTMFIEQKMQQELVMNYLYFTDKYKKEGTIFPIDNEYVQNTLEALNAYYEAFGEEEALMLWKQENPLHKKRKTIRPSFRFYIELNKKYDSGFKKIGSKASTQQKQERMINIGDKIKDSHYLINKLIHNNGMKPTIKRIHEYITVYGKGKEPERYVYEYDKVLNKYKIIALEGQETTLLTLPLLDAEEYFDYSYNVHFTKTKRKCIIAPQKITSKPETLININKKRFKKIYSFKNTQYFTLHIVLMKEWGKRMKDNKGQWDQKPQRKSFIELDFNFNKFYTDYEPKRKKSVQTTGPKRRPLTDKQMIQQMIEVKKLQLKHENLEVPQNIEEIVTKELEQAEREREEYNEKLIAMVPEILVDMFNKQIKGIMQQLY